MTFDFWAVANSAEFQNQAAEEAASHSGSGFKNFEEDGEYVVTIGNAEIRTANAGYQKLTLRVKADTGETGFWDLLVGHGGGISQAAKIAQRDLALILKYTGAKASSPSMLNGLRLKVWVKMEEYNDKLSPRFRPIGAVTAGSAPATSKPAPAASAPAAAERDAANADMDDDIPF